MGACEGARDERGMEVRRRNEMVKKGYRPRRSDKRKRAFSIGL